jgi:hypothetical protein
MDGHGQHGRKQVVGLAGALDALSATAHPEVSRQSDERSPRMTAGRRNGLEYEAVHLEVEPPPASGLRSVLMCGLGAGAGFLISEVLDARFDWSAVGLLFVLAMLLVGVERMIYGVQLAVQALRLQKQSERDLERLKDLTSRPSAE